MIRVGVIGACGRMGQTVCRAAAESEDMRLAAAIDLTRVGHSIGPIIGHPKLDVPITDELDRLLEAEVEVAVDFTRPDAVMDNVRWCIEHAVNLVVGTSGITDENLEEIRQMIDDGDGEPNVIVVPNFALGAVLMERFASMAVRFFPAVEIIELHHEEKADAPSATAISTARRMLDERETPHHGPGDETVEGVRGGDLEGVRVHSVRLPGLVAHQEIIFGGQGQTLTIRHDSVDRSSYMPGVLMAIRAVSTRPGLTIGLDTLLDLPPGS
jgi:4-hydroxy-tetrahydrodipicolinate reductase